VGNVGEIPHPHPSHCFWQSQEAMEQFACGKKGKHFKAVKIIRQLKGFREELYVRFQVLGRARSMDATPWHK